MEVSFYLRFVNFDKLARLLDAAREAAENGREGEDVLTFDGLKFLVWPCGATGRRRQKAHLLPLATAMRKRPRDSAHEPRASASHDAQRQRAGDVGAVDAVGSRAGIQIIG